MAAAPVFVGTQKTFGVEFTNAIGVTSTLLYTAGASGSRIAGLSATNNDTIAHVFKLLVQIGGAGTQFLLCSVTIAIGAGSTGVASGNLLDAGQCPWVMEDGSILLGPNDKLFGQMEVTLGAAKLADILGEGGDL